VRGKRELANHEALSREKSSFKSFSGGLSPLRDKLEDLTLTQKGSHVILSISWKKKTSSSQEEEGVSNLTQARKEEDDREKGARKKAHQRVRSERGKKQRGGATERDPSHFEPLWGEGGKSREARS